MNRTSHRTVFLMGILTALLLGGCSNDDSSREFPGDTVPVRFEINSSQAFMRTPGNPALSVNRILILPFKKKDETLPNDAVNFEPDYLSAKQFDVNTFPTVATMLSLSSASTYQMQVIGYNRNDYDFADRLNLLQRFSIGSAVLPTTLANIHLQPVNTPDVPEFFSGTGKGYMNYTLVDSIFKPGQINNIKANLTRLVSGFTLQMTNVTADVQSITLVAQQLVSAISAVNGRPLVYPASGTGVEKIIDQQLPVAGSVTFNKFILPTSGALTMQFYLDVAYSTGLPTKRFTLKVADYPGVVSGNNFTFTPNHWEMVAGDYTKIDFGFVITDSINLDDNLWDGLQ